MKMIEKETNEAKRKLVTFDLNQNALKNHYPKPPNSSDPLFYKKAYKDIGQFLFKHGFEHPQYSVYTSIEPMEAYDIVQLMEAISARFPWLKKCINSISVTDVAELYDLTGIVCGPQVDFVRATDVELESAPKDAHPSGDEARYLDSVEGLICDATAKTNSAQTHHVISKSQERDIL